MRTPRHAPSSTPGRGFGTLIGNGWLRESPRPRGAPRMWDARSRSSLRKCMLMQVSPELVELGRAYRLHAGVPAPAPRAPSPSPSPRRAALAPIVPHRRDPALDARIFPAVSPHAIVAAALDAASARAWWEDPIALGSLLVICPPVGLAALWCSKRYSSDARRAITVVTALMISFAGALALALVLAR